MRVIFAILSAVAGLPAPALAQPVFEVRGGSFPPGKTDGFVDIWLRPDNGQLISGWNLLLRYNPSAIAGVSIESTRSADLFTHTDQDLFTEPGTVSAATVYSLSGDATKMVGTGSPVARIRFCVLSTAVEGEYPVEVIPVARIKEGSLVGAEVFTTVTVLDEHGSGQSVNPLAEHGVIEVTGAGTQEGACSPDIHVPPVDVPQIGYVWKAPRMATLGSDVLTWIEVSTNVPLVGYSCAMRFDPTVLSPHTIELHQDWLHEEASFERVFLDGGDIGIAVVPDLEGRNFMPSGTSRVAEIPFAVHSDGGTGSTALEFVPVVEREWEDVAGQNRIAFYNVVSLGAVSGLPGTEGDSVEVTDVVAAHLGIAADVMFRRGDGDSSGELDISDAVRTLSYLFLGHERMPCPDGADTDDSGTLDIADPIALLQFLFHGGTPPAPPGPTDAGSDPTEDDLGCSEL